MTRGAGRIRIRTGHSYHVYFSIVLGQENATFVERPLTPLARLMDTRLAPYAGWTNSVSFVPEHGFDALHTWNAVPMLTRRPYVVTFEDFMPRTPEDRRIPWLEAALSRRLARDRCVRLIATSDYAMRQFHHQHRDNPLRDVLAAKLERIYPVVEPRRTSPKPRSDGLRLLFVGRDFMRKGGPVLLRAHARLRAAGVPVETTIVSSLGWKASDYVGPPDAAYVKAAERGLAQDGITHHRSLATEKVRELMDRSDYFIFPTFHDTFGFVAIEALAGGTPVIASDTCVQPEIVTPGGNGYLLPFQNDADVGKWIWLYKQAEPGYLDAYDQATTAMAAALADRLERSWEDRAGYEALSAGAVSAAMTRFHPDSARRRLEEIYEGFRRS